ncbi:hypothetical protein [Paractinoplanes abujensis]|uniref:Uncharacterized protein n=1 Tax=Paractinoplanes abujensis TaxID=882441 RepID=A0A7W7CQN7_9ACTN|nr:hypothetical protein [Actinoplanes abujensis]MBB4692659.1 hypothetical protein [Actinoplanes abujensis]
MIERRLGGGGGPRDAGVAFAAIILRVTFGYAVTARPRVFPWAHGIAG